MLNDERSLWMVVADFRRGRLLRGRSLASGRRVRRRVELVDSIDNPWGELQDPSLRGRAAPVPGQNPRQVEFVGRYANEVARWLEAHVKKHGIDALEVFAPPALRGALRARYPSIRAGRIEDHAGDLGRLSPTELEREERVTALFDALDADTSDS